MPVRMTAPRQVLPGTTYLVTRRCTRRQFLLRPSRATSALFLYVLAVAARRFGVRVHAFCVLSNHYHLVVTDPDARLPAFGQYLDSLVARATNSLLGRWESFWAPSSYSAVALATPEDVVEKCAYVLANPVAAGLVRRGRDWPGLWSAPEQIGGVRRVVSRPAEFFRADGVMPRDVEFELSAPPGFESAREFKERLGQALEVLEDEAGRKRVSNGSAFVGQEKVLRQKPTRHPKPFEPRRNLNPRFAARDKWKRIEVLGRLKEFLAEYREAWRGWRDGRRERVFPQGTYLMRVLHGARCVDAGMAT